MKKEELYWAAGFMEGEGSFSNLKKNFVYSQVTAAQNELEPLERLQRLFGGSIYKLSRTERRDVCYHWAVRGYQARGVAMTLFSLMSHKRKDQIKRMLKGDTSTSRGTKAYHDRMVATRRARM